MEGRLHEILAATCAMNAWEVSVRRVGPLPADGGGEPRGVRRARPAGAGALGQPAAAARPARRQRHSRR